MQKMKNELCNKRFENVLRILNLPLSVFLLVLGSKLVCHEMRIGYSTLAVVRSSDCYLAMDLP